MSGNRNPVKFDKAKRSLGVFGLSLGMGAALTGVIGPFAHAGSNQTDLSQKSPVLMSGEWISKEKSAARSKYLGRSNLESIRKFLLEKAKPVAKLPASALKLNGSGVNVGALQNSISSIGGLLGSGSLVISQDAKEILPGLAAATMPNSDCDSEIGAESSLDQVYTDQRWSSTSLVKHVSFPLRRHLSCTRSQGNRGTCTAFATLAALEALFHQKYNRHLNLSEQHLAFWGWVNVDPDDSEGMPLGQLIDAMASENYLAPYESGWQYNGSFFRDDQDSSGNLDGSFKDVCVGYSESNGGIHASSGEYCSETIHQGATQRITKHLSQGGSDYTLTYTNYSAPSSAVPSYNSVASSVQLWDEDNPRSSLEVVKAYLQSGIPLVFGGGVTQSFQTNMNRGFVPYNRGEANLGGHAMLMVAWVPNSSLPSGAPSGSGGGYFVFKNSWGMSQSNDRGYYYVPFNYMLEHTAGIRAVTARN